jgi:hypothetical protein
MSQGRSGTSPTKGGSMPQPSYQNPFGSQSYRQPSSPSKGGQPSFGGPAYQQSGQFGGQIMNRPMQSPGGKGGQSRPPLEIQPYPMPSPGGKGGSYQRPPTPLGYGQPTFAPQQFAGYGQPSNIFSFNNPHYQPYNPAPIQQQPNPNTGNTGNPMTPTPEVTAQPVDQTAAMRDQIRSLGQEGLQSGAVTRDMLVQAGYSNPDQILAGANPGQSKTSSEVIMPPPTPPAQTSIPPEPQTRPDPYPIYDRVGGYNPSMPFLGGKGGTRTAGDEFRVFDPYGEGGAYEGQPRPTFPDPTQPQGPQGAVEGAPPVNLGPEPFDQVIGRGVVGPRLEQLSGPDWLDEINRRGVVGPSSVDVGQLAAQQAASLGLNDEASKRAAEQARQQFQEQLRNPDVPQTASSGIMGSGIGSRFDMPPAAGAL